MELFSEIYGFGYEAIARALAKAPLSLSQLRRIVRSGMTADGATELLSRLESGDWPMLVRTDEGFESALCHAPNDALTLLELRFLRALLDDPRMQAFLTDAQMEAMRAALEAMRAALEGVAPLYRQADFAYFDRYADGDDYADAGYRARFGRLLGAMRAGKAVSMDYVNAQGEQTGARYMPLTLEYSGKDDKFRLLCVREDGQLVQRNLSRVLALEEADAFAGADSADERPAQLRCEEPLVIEVTQERQALERFMLEFSYLEKRSEFDEARQVATIRLWYNPLDEMEIIVRLLGFGPTLRVLSPGRCVDEMKRRVSMQAQYLPEDVPDMES